MSGFMGRPYIANLNAIPSAEDLAAQQQDNLDVDEDLSKYRIDEFFDIDMGERVDAGGVGYDATMMDRARRQNATAQANNNVAGVDYLEGAYQFPEYPGFQDMLNDNSVVVSPALPNGQYALQIMSPSSSASPSANLNSGTYSNLTDSTPGPSGAEEKSRQLAEEDKRRRNTAASARFRVKKKQREQVLEKTVKEQTDKNTVLETEISRLRMENKWLKDLVTEKNESKDDIAELWRKFHKDGADASSTVQRKDGVGTVKGEKAA